MKKTTIILAAMLCLAMTSCRYVSVEPSYTGDGSCIECELDTTIPATITPEKATDSDTPGTDKELYWEAGDFSNKVTVGFNGAAATVSTEYTGVAVTIDGANVTLDFASKGGKNAEVTVSGTTTDGSLKIISADKTLLTLSTADIGSAKGPAITCLGESKLFINLAGGAICNLSDGKAYATPEGISDDMKACFYIQGPTVVSGKGILAVTGNANHAIAVDDYMIIRPGASVAVKDAAADGILLSGSDELDPEGSPLGLRMLGGLLNVKVSSVAGKAVNVGASAKFLGGEAAIYSTGTCIFVESDLDIHQSVALNVDSDIVLNNADVTVKASGKGGRAVLCGGSITLDESSILATTSGELFKYHNLLACPGAIDAGRFMNVKRSDVDVAAAGLAAGAIALQTGKKLTLTSGNLYAYAYDNAVKIQDLEIDGGYFFALSRITDAVNSDNDIDINGGLVEVAAMSKAMSFSGTYSIDDATVLTLGETLSVPNDTTQTYLKHTYGVSANTGDTVSMLTADGSTEFSFKVHRSSYSNKLLYSSPELDDELTYNIYKWGTVSGSTTQYRLLIDGGSYSGGYFVESLTPVAK